MVLTLMEMAQKGQEIPLFTLVAQNEQMNVQLLMERVASGRIVIPYNSHHKPPKPQGFGLGLSTKVSASIGLAADEDRTNHRYCKSWRGLFNRLDVPQRARKSALCSI